MKLKTQDNTTLGPNNTNDNGAGKTKRKSSISKQEYFRTLVKHDTEHLRFRYVLADSWFACSDNMRFVLEDCGRDFIMAMKENRKVALSKQDKANGKYISIKEAVSEKCVRSDYVERIGATHNILFYHLPETFLKRFLIHSA